MVGRSILNCLLISYSKKQNNKFPQSGFKIYNYFLFLSTFIIHIRQGDGRCIQNLVREPEGKMSVQRRKQVWDDNIKLDLTSFDLRLNDKGLWM